MQRRYIYHPITHKYLTFNGNNNPVTLEKYNQEDSIRQQWDITGERAYDIHKIISVANPEQCLDTRVEYLLPQRSLLYTIPCAEDNNVIYQQWVFLNPIKEINRDNNQLETQFQIMNPNFNQSYLDATGNTNINVHRYLSYFRDRGLPDPQPGTDIYFNRSSVFDLYERFTFLPV